MTDLLPVTQEDREAAADWCESQPFPSKQAEAPMIRAGEYDHHSLVQAFARHRPAQPDAEPGHTWSGATGQCVDCGAHQAIDAEADADCHPAEPGEGDKPVAVTQADMLLMGLLRREGRHSGVWFAHKLLEAADRIEALSSQLSVALTQERAWRDDCAEANGKLLAANRELAARPTPAAPADDELARGKRDLLSLLDSVWRAEFSKEAPNWKPLDDLPGMVSQIDNMYAGVRAQRDEARHKLGSGERGEGELVQIVHWLRSDEAKWHHPLTDEAILSIADAIEQGRHRRGE